MENVIYEVSEGVAVITLNRPQAKNAIDAATAQAIEAAMDRLEADPSVRVGILTGAGGTFCSGMDLKAFLRGEVVVTPRRGFAGIASCPPPVPLIAAIEGYSVAGGFEIALSCDLIVASRAAQFGLPEVRRGLVATAGGMLRIPGLLPPNVAHELVLTGRMASAQEMAGYGLVNRLVDEGEALQGAKALAAEIAANGPVAVRTSKAVMRQSLHWSQDEMFERQDEAARPVFTSEDAKEGARAFAEKRAPRWSGR
ncbi:crotonase/enoyl-CoA hydratase family protein [Antarcticimicrobium sediminis]|uniref:Crotonase/enoyl-CoA hydratase family protein n=1 Tax=Antarcticimicrobium sediminis TaxID=2546227 RepID=A0A4R5EM78_9RHOB|nr:crotonase/enoyl-CoA hydratase family protein [Antarcticimicrobium sediminis]TDE35662.1 crotonase/enoyl-CoA hydratase family protein [Antarcticimicrobium sediminis]